VQELVASVVLYRYYYSNQVQQPLSTNQVPGRTN